MAIYTDFLKLHETNIDINKDIDLFKTQIWDKNLLGRLAQQANSLNTEVNLARLNCSPNDTHFQSINIACERTLARVNKLLSKYSLQQQPNAPQTPALQLAQRAQNLGYISFYDDQTDPLTGSFGNFHSCAVEFGGKHYKNSEAVFQAQKYTDQAHLMGQFENMTGDQAVQTARSTTMTPNRLAQWDGNAPNVNKIDVMMNVLRAKFGQNSDLKALLLATGNAYLVEHLPDPHRKDRFWSDGFDGSGQNQLGICLMKLRGEYGGANVVNKPNLQQLYAGSLSTRTSTVSNSKMCKLPGCNKLAHPGFDFCGRAHGQTYNAQNQRSNAPQNPGNCLCGRTKRIETDAYGNVLRVHDYCSLTCARNAGATKQ